MMFPPKIPEKNRINRSILRGDFLSVKFFWIFRWIQAMVKAIDWNPWQSVYPYQHCEWSYGGPSK